MSALCLLLLSAGLFRTPNKTALPLLETERVWVYFTDKGISTGEEYQAALDAVRAAARPEQLRRRQREPIAGFDFDDLPVSRGYVRRITDLGGRLRSTSSWLNAACFDLPRALHTTVYALPFVYDLKPVLSQTWREPADVVPLPAARVRSQATDTAEAHRFYGPSYDQAQLMGVPDLFFSGYFGSGVKLAIFDTGLKLGNVAVEGLRVQSQHDFISGDNFCSFTDSVAAIDKLRFLGLVKDPVVAAAQDRTLLCFVADSFAYAYNPPRRAIWFSAYSTQGWLDPAPIALSQQATPLSSHTFENLELATGPAATYLVYNDLKSNYRARPAAQVYLGYFEGTAWHTAAQLASGRWPSVAVFADSLWLAYVSDDTLLVVRKAGITAAEPVWTLANFVTAPERTDRVLIAGDNQGRVSLVCHGIDSGRLLAWHSTDGGATFAGPAELVAAGAGQTTMLLSATGLFLFYQDLSVPVQSRIGVIQSTDFGASWQPGSPATGNLLALGGFAATGSGTDLIVYFENGGFLNRTSSQDAGLTWQTPAQLDTTGFACFPCATGTMAVWARRGDESAVWEQADTLRFSREQSDHGTRMASIIAGYQPGGVVGVAPGVDLLIAKTEFHKTSSGRYYEYNLEEDTYIEALEWAERLGADIVSTSLGYRGWYSDSQLDGKTAPISQAAALAARRGMLVVTAMGNRDTLTYPWPNPYIVAPADADGVIAAGGVERNLLPWRGTGTGPTADGRPKPELVALSDTVAVVAPDSINGLEGSVGTSCATALVAGACALLREAHPSWSADSLKAVLFATATNAPAQSCTTGFGMPRLDSAFRRFPPDDARPIRSDELWAMPNPYLPAADGNVRFAINLTRPTSKALIYVYTASGTMIDTVRLNTEPMGRPGKYREPAVLDAIGSVWDGTTAGGRPAASGMYLAVLHTTFGNAVTKFALVR